MHPAKGDRFVRANELPVRQCQTPNRGVLPILPSICAYFKNVPKSKKCVIIVAINAKLKLLKVLSSYNNALCDSSKLFFTTIKPGNMGPSDILRKVWRNSQIMQISFNMPKGFMGMPRLLDLDLGIGIHT